MNKEGNQMEKIETAGKTPARDPRKDPRPGDEFRVKNTGEEIEIKSCPKLFVLGEYNLWVVYDSSLDDALDGPRQIRMSTMRRKLRDAEVIHAAE